MLTGGFYRRLLPNTTVYVTNHLLLYYLVITLNLGIQIYRIAINKRDNILQ